MLKSIFTSILFLVIVETTAQSTIDTTQAVNYFQDALQLIEAKDTSDKAVLALSKAHAIYSNTPFSERKIEIAALYSYALMLNNEQQKAENLAKETINFTKVQTAENDRIFAYAYRTLQLVYYDKDYKKSIEYGQQALKRTELTSDIYFDIAENIVRNYAYLDEVKAAENLIAQLEEQLLKQPQPIHQIVIYRIKMQYFLISGLYEKAIIFGKKLLDENEKIQKYPPKKLASMYVELGNAYLGLKKYNEAITWMEKGIDSAPYENNEPIIGTYLANMANVYSKKNELPKAVDYYEKSKVLLAKDTNRFAQSLKVVYINLGAVYYNMNDLNKAEQNLKIAIDLGAKDPNLDLNLANILGQQERYAEALQLIQSALLKVSFTFTNPDFRYNPSPYESYNNPNAIGYILISKGVYLHRLGKQQNDIKLMQQGQATLDLAIKTYKDKVADAKGFEATKFVLNSGVLLTLGYKLVNQYEIYEQFPTNENFETIFEIMEQRKAMLLLETLTPSALPVAILKKEETIIDNIQQIGQAIDLAKANNQKAEIAAYEQQLFEANHDLEVFLAMIQRDYPKESQEVYPVDYATTTQVQATINTQTLVISYSYYQNKGFVTTISNDSKKVYKIDPTAIDKNIKRLHQLIQDPFAFQKPKREEFIEVSHRLYQILLQPIEAELTNKTQLMIIQEGNLFHLPFELLLAKNDKKPYHELDFLIKKYAINYHYSATAYLKLQAKSTLQDGSLLAFAPVFEKGDELSSVTRSLDFMVDSLYESFDNNRFATLPNTKKEVNAIADLLDNKTTTNVLLKRKATKDNLQTALESQSYQFVHIATHGIVNFKNPKLSAIACYASRDNLGNLLYADEVQRSDINADLVILSSCESGIGQLVEGEGLIALNRSFFYAGAKNVLFSLWKVNDEYSSDLMIDFYKNYFKESTYTAALRQAKLQLIADSVTAQPKYWAAFVLMGE